MNIRCPECATIFRVDPSRIPPAGVRARCSRCRASFRVTRDGLDGGGASTATGQQPAAQASAASSATPAPVPQYPTAPPPADTGVRAGQPGQHPPAADQAAAEPVEDPATPVPTSAPAAAPPAETPRTPVFGSRDPNSRAQRIARALVSDIVAYHPERRDACLAAGTLRTAFREEIMKSWEEYVAQVGLDMAKSTPYFRESLNSILARGQQVF